MGILLRQNKNIKGIYIENKEYKLFQYADDTGILLDGSESSLRSALNLLDQFSKYSGLTPNLEKTRCIWIGSSKERIDRLCTDIELQWSQEPFTVLGINFSLNLNEMIELNFDEKINDIRKLITHWSKRNLTVLGKITVVKTIIMSKLTHLFISLPNPDLNFMKLLESMLFKYIWGSKMDRISRKQIVKDYGEGGCRMIHLPSFLKSLKVSWIKRLMNTNAAWTELFFDIFKTNRCMIESFGSYYPTILSNRIDNKFWRDSLLSFHEFHTNLIYEQTDILTPPLWYNNDIQIDRKTVFYKILNEKGCRFINDLIDCNGTFLSYINFCTQFEVNIPFLIYHGLKNTIIKKWPVLRSNTLKKLASPFLPKHMKLFIKNNKGSRNFYDLFLNSVKHNKRYLEKRSSDLQSTLDQAHLLKQTSYVFKYTNDINLRWFNYRIAHRILATNDYLFKIKIRNSNLCSFCGNEVETLKHLFISCELVDNIWTLLEQWIYEKCGFLLNYSKLELLFGKIGNRFSAPNTIVLLVKHYIYRQRLKGELLLFESIKRKIYDYYIMERYIDTIINRLDIFRKKWSTFNSLF